MVLPHLQTKVTVISATLNGVSGSTNFTVTAATLVSLAISPTNPSIAKGLTQQFTATATYTDNSTQNVTTSSVWSSGTGSVATVSSGGGSEGLALQPIQGQRLLPQLLADRVQIRI
ncbi:MAG: Ig-like domain-containing protein [Leptospiraceae bacterium]|nr:Ig-like domain-containing protein [Leptospiraceae bacterium]